MGPHRLQNCQSQFQLSTVVLVSKTFVFKTFNKLKLFCKIFQYLSLTYVITVKYCQLKLKLTLAQFNFIL